MYVCIWQVATCFSTIRKCIVLGPVLYSHAFRFGSDSRWFFCVCWFAFASPIPANVNIIMPNQVNAKRQGKDTVKAHSTRLLVSGCRAVLKTLSSKPVKIQNESRIAVQCCKARWLMKTQRNFSRLMKTQRNFPGSHRWSALNISKERIQQA